MTPTITWESPPPDAFELEFHLNAGSGVKLNVGSPVGSNLYAVTTTQTGVVNG
jgi:hypothetical protein